MSICCKVKVNYDPAVMLVCYNIQVKYPNFVLVNHKIEVYDYHNITLIADAM